MKAGTQTTGLHCSIPTATAGGGEQSLCLSHCQLSRGEAHAYSHYIVVSTLTLRSTFSLNLFFFFFQTHWPGTHLVGQTGLKFTDTLLP